MILNDAKAKYKTSKSLIETLIDNSPMSDSVFDEIIEAYETKEDEAMELMHNCVDGTFIRNFIDGGFTFEPNEENT